MWRGKTNFSDRLWAALPYLLPLIGALAFGMFLFRSFPFLQIIYLPLLPVLTLYSAIPFASFIVFFGLYLLVVRNENILHFIRYNTMQAILIDIFVSLCGLIFNVLLPAIPIPFLSEVLYNTVFLGVLASVLYSVVQCFRGVYPEIPWLSDAVYMQVR